MIFIFLNNIIQIDRKSDEFILKNDLLVLLNTYTINTIPVKKNVF